MENGFALDYTDFRKRMKEKYGLRAKFYDTHMFYQELREPVHYFKETEGGRAIVCEAIETYGNDKRNEGRAEGRAEGKLEKAREMAIELYKNGVSAATIASAAGVPEEVIHKWLGIETA